MKRTIFNFRTGIILTGFFLLFSGLWFFGKPLVWACSPTDHNNSRSENGTERLEPILITLDTVKANKLKILQDSLNSFQLIEFENDKAARELIQAEKAIKITTDRLYSLVADTIKINAEIKELIVGLKNKAAKGGNKKRKNDKNTDARARYDSSGASKSIKPDSVKKAAQKAKISPDSVISGLKREKKAKINDIQFITENLASYKINHLRQKEMVSVNYERLTAAKVRLMALIDSLSGEIRFKYRETEYAGFIAEKGKHSVALHWDDKNGDPWLYLPALKKYLEGQKREVLMITNGGMFDPNHKPQGLFISEGRKLMDLDSTKPKDAGNFYLQPNGVFWIDYEGNYHADTTEAFLNSPAFRNFSDKTVGAKYATQSGPMLVANGRINREFNKASSNRKVRSGVGVKSETRAIFLCTLGNENFYNFSALLRDLFGCQNALFLDGAISKMYLPQLNPNDEGGSFGPMISVVGLAPMKPVKQKKGKK